MDYNEHFQRYSNYQPTGFDTTGLGGRRNGISGHFVMPVQRHRDSDILGQSNFDAFLNELGGESTQVEVHRFGHWGCGWFELILVHPEARDKLDTAVRCASALSRYPILSDSDYSERMFEAVCDDWESSRLGDRIDMCRDAGISIFASRQETPPEDVYEHIASRL